MVVPTYNRAELLQQTIKSILAQTVPAWEVIVVDDGSTDHTANVCAGFGNSIRYVRQENQGLSMARNAGIRASRGDWIAFCDSDDLWHPRKLEIQLAAAETLGAGWSITDFALIAADGSPHGGGGSFRGAFALFEESGMKPGDHFRRWLRAHTLQIAGESVSVYAGDAFGMFFEGNVALPSTAIVARKVLDEAGGFNARFRAEETEFFHRIAAQTPVAVVMNKLVHYRVGHPSLISGAPIPFIEDALLSLQLATTLRPALTPAERSAFRRGRRRLLMRMAYTRLSALDRRGARQAVYSAWSEGSVLSPRLAGIMVAAFLPESALRALQRLKRTISSGANG